MKKCNKFQEYFIFSTEEKLLEHIRTCPDCKAEYDKFEKISNLVKEVKPLYKAKKKNSLITKVACFSGLVMITASVGVVNNIMTNIEYDNYNNYLQDSITMETSYPVDDYGLIKVN